jgi:hypothetical protein
MSGTSRLRFAAEAAAKTVMIMMTVLALFLLGVDSFFRTIVDFLLGLAK